MGVIPVGYDGLPVLFHIADTWATSSGLFTSTHLNNWTRHHIAKLGEEELLPRSTEFSHAHNTL